MTVESQVKNVTEQFEEIVTNMGERIVETNELVADTVTPFIPNFDLPFAEKLPKPAELVDSTFDLFGKAPEFLSKGPDFLSKRNDLLTKSIERNHKFVGRIVDAWTPADAGDAVTNAAAKTTKATKKTATAAKKTTKTAARKTSATAKKARK